jgi:cold shock CspA family protein
MACAVQLEIAMPTLPLQITFRNVPPSEAIESKIRERASHLEAFSDRIMRCHVVVEAPHRHRRKGYLYSVRIDLTVPGEEIAINRVPDAKRAQRDMNVAIRDAFDAARRKLEDHARRFRGDVKTHEAAAAGRVVRVEPLDGYGFLETPGGLRVYFHENALVGCTIAELEPDTEVRFVLAEGEGLEGPQASMVRAVGKHHVLAASE